jgi:hypothetical protein
MEGPNVTQVPDFQANHLSLRLDDQWIPVSLPTSLFSIEEFPMDDLSSMSAWSAGEEISESEIVALKWSPPGVAPYQRSALAVLTSNLILSIWDPSKKSLTKVSQWRRAFTVNSVLSDYYEKSNPSTSRTPEGSRREQLRTFQRIRSFAWAPSLPDKAALNFIAVSNDTGDIVIVDIESRSGQKYMEYSTAIAASFPIVASGQVPDRVALNDTFEEIMSFRRFASHLAWSPWLANGKGFISIIAVAAQSGVSFTKITMLQDGTLSLKRVSAKIQMSRPNSVAGPFLFSQYIKEKCVTFYTTLDEEVVCCQIELLKGDIKLKTEHHREEWDGVSGMSNSSNCSS